MRCSESSSLLTHYQGGGYDAVREDDTASDIQTCVSSLGDVTAATLKDDEEEVDLAAKRRNHAPLLLVLSGLWVGLTLSSLDSSIVATIYPQIGTEFRSSNNAVWIATSYMVSHTALQPIYGRLSDAFGRKSALTFATTVFFIGSLLCGLATNMPSLVFARAIAGVGGGGLKTMAAIIISDLVPLRQRAHYQGYCNIADGVGAVLGAPLGGIITDTIGWRYCFLINVPLLLLSMYVCTQILYDYNLEEQGIDYPLFERMKDIDYAGSATLVTGAVSFLLATSLGGNMLPWSDPFIIGCFVVMLAAGACFCFVEARFAVHPVMPMSIVTTQSPLACLGTTFFAVMASFGMTFTTPLFYQGLLGYPASQSALITLPKVVALWCGSVMSGLYVAKTGHYRRFIRTAAMTAVFGMLAISCWEPDSSLGYMVFCLILDGWSTGAITTTIVVAMLSCLEKKDSATITSISFLFRHIGTVLGVSGTAAIFQGTTKAILTKEITGPGAQAIIDTARNSMMDVRELLPPEVLPVVLDAYQTAIRFAFYFCVLASFMSLICTMFVKQNKLNTKVSTWQKPSEVVIDRKPLKLYESNH